MGGDAADHEAQQSHREEAGDLARSLRWTPEQLQADEAAKMLLAAEESLLGAHASVLTTAAAGLVEEQQLVDDAASGATVDMDDYVRKLQAALHRRRVELESLEASLSTYRQRCAVEEEARRHVSRPVSLPWG